MAYFRKTATGGWRAEVVRKGVRTSETFQRKAEAEAWAAKVEAEILAGARGSFPNKTLGEALTDYEKKVSSQKRSGHFEELRFKALKRDFPELCAKVMHRITTADLAAWRDARLASVSGSTVIRESHVLRHVWTVAANEWKWCEEPGPWKGLRMPRENLPRTRRVPWTEVKRICRWAGLRYGRAPQTAQGIAAMAFLVALRTAMRAGEVVGLERRDVDLQRRVATLRRHKTLEIVGERTVPLTKQAARLLAVMAKDAEEKGRALLFETTPDRLAANFVKLLKMCGVEGLHFHDSRGEALTLLSKRMDAMRLARISGHRDINVLLNTYYRETAEQVAAGL